MPRHALCRGIRHVRASVTAAFAPVPSAYAAPGCRVTYTVTSQWPGGFGANVTIGNLGDPVNG